MPTLLTIGDIAKQANAPHHRVDYIIRTRAIAPVGRAGRLRLFDADAVARIIAELKGTKTNGQ